MSRAKAAAAGAAALILAALAGFFLPSLYRHLVFFPRLEREIAARARERGPVSPPAGGLSDVRVILHVHTHRSFDSRGSDEDVAAAAAAAGARAVFLSEHPAPGAEVEIPAARHAAEVDGVLLVPGVEVRPGSAAVWSPEARALGPDPGWEDLRRASLRGALAILTHPRGAFEAHPGAWAGIEIYNAHDDVRDEDPWRVAPQLLISRRRFPEIVCWWLSDEPRARLRLWDRLLARGRPIVGVGGNDAHEGLGIELQAGEGGDLRVRTTGGLPIATVEVGGPVARALRRLGGARGGRGEPGREGILLRAVVDPYEVSFRVISTHLLSRCLSLPCLDEALRAGRAYVAFDLIGDPAGFRFEAKAAGGAAPMGGRIPAGPGIALVAESPLPARLRLLRDGALAAEAPGRRLEHAVEGPGAYRIEASVSLAGRNDLPWVLTNPIYVGSPGEVARGRLLRKAEHVRDVIESRHLPEGLVLNARLDAQGRPAGYQDFGDQAIWTGIYTLACAERALTTRAAEDIRALERAARALHTLHAVTGGEGRLARGVRGPAAPGDGEGLRWFPGGPGYERFRWAGDISKDQLIGFVAGSAAAHEAALVLGSRSLAEAVASLGRDLRAIVLRAAQEGWVLRDPDGRPTRHGDLRPGRAGVRWDAVNALIALAAARAAATLSGDPRVEDLYRRELVGRLDYPGFVRRWLRVDFGPFTRFDNANMAFLALRALLALETDVRLARLYASTLRERLWEGWASSHRNPFFAFIALSARARGDGPGARRVEDARAHAEAIEALRDYPWTLRNRRVRPPSDLPLAWLGDRKGRLRARDPAPVSLRPPSVFLWKEDPRRVQGGADDGREFPGVDYLAAYWLGRREGLVAPHL